MINKNKKLFFKFITASFVVSVLAVGLGFLGTHLILSSQEKRIENHFIPESLRVIELIHKKTGMPINEVVDDYNVFVNTREESRGGPRRLPPLTISVIKKNDSRYSLPERIGTFKEISAQMSAPKMFKDQIYNYDGENFLVFKFNPPPADGGPDMLGPPPGGPGGPPGPRGFSLGRGRAVPIFVIPVTLTFVILLLIVTSSSLLVLYFLKRQAAKAESVLRDLKSGNLKARFPISKIDEASELMLEFNQMADEIEKLVVDLKDTDNHRRKLLQELAHDLRTPIASMKSLLESLLYQGERMTKELREENLQLSIKEVEYFHHLVEDLLFLSGVHDLKYRGKFATVDICDIIQHEVQVANETSHDVKVNLIFDDFYFVRADQHLFQRLMKNAISNAIENADTVVQLKIIKKDDSVVVEICNDGQTLSEEDIATFGKKRFTRKINETTEGKISVGLGAVIMNKICEILSAQMVVANNSDNNGVTLQFLFKNLEA